MSLNEPYYIYTTIKSVAGIDQGKWMVAEHVTQISFKGFEELDFFLYHIREEGKWVVVESYTGTRIIEPCDNEAKALQDTQAVLEKHGKQNILAFMSGRAKDNGISPRYLSCFPPYNGYNLSDDGSKKDGSFKFIDLDNLP